MKRILIVSIFILFAGFVLCAGCSSYAPLNNIVHTAGDFIA